MTVFWTNFWFIALFSVFWYWFGDFLGQIHKFYEKSKTVRKIENRYEELQIRANSADSCQKQSWFSKFILKSFWKLKKLLTGYKPFITGYCILGVTITTNVTYIHQPVLDKKILWMNFVLFLTNKMELF